MSHQQALFPQQPPVAVAQPDWPPVPSGTIAVLQGRTPDIMITIGRDPTTDLWWWRPLVLHEDGSVRRTYGPWGGYHWDPTVYATTQWCEIPTR